MSYQERRALVSLLSTILIPVFYSAYMFQNYPNASDYSPEVFRFWGAFFLILIPVSVIAGIILIVMFSIISTIATKEGEPSIVDERDKLIELKAMRNSMYLFILGVFLGMGALVIDQPPSAMFVTIFIFGIVSAIVGDLSQFYYYRRGV